MRTINLTPHPIIVVSGPDAGTYPSAGIARVGRLPLGRVEGLPAPAEGTRYIVSIIVAERLPLRDDLLVPGEQQRDSEGRVIGARSLVPARDASPALAMLHRALQLHPSLGSALGLA